MINNVTLIGRLGKKPELNKVGEKAIAKFSLATNRPKKIDGTWTDETEWHNIVCFDKRAEYAEKFDKGQLVYVEGSIHYNKYESDGITKIFTEIIANKVKLLEKLNKNDVPF